MSDKTSQPEHNEDPQARRTAPEQKSEKSEKKEYKKPELRKYTQIDYVTAYGVD